MSIKYNYDHCFISHPSITEIIYIYILRERERERERERKREIVAPVLQKLWVSNSTIKKETQDCLQRLFNYSGQGLRTGTLFGWADNRRMVYQCVTDSLEQLLSGLQFRVLNFFRDKWHNTHTHTHTHTHIYIYIYIYIYMSMAHGDYHFIVFAIIR